MQQASWLVRFTMRSFLVLLCLALLAPQTAADPVTRGYGLLKANCARCHAIGTGGESPRRDAPPFRAVMKSYPASSLTEALGEGLITGHPDMPEFSFPPEDVGAIVSYLQTLEGLK
jgi:mono/diheme cytochrome c family protein